MVPGKFFQLWRLRYPSQCHGSCNVKVASPSPVSGLGPLSRIWSVHNFWLEILGVKNDKIHCFALGCSFIYLISSPRSRRISSAIITSLNSTRNQFSFDLRCPTPSQLPAAPAAPYASKSPSKARGGGRGDRVQAFT